MSKFKSEFVILLF